MRCGVSQKKRNILSRLSGINLHNLLLTTQIVSFLSGTNVTEMDYDLNFKFDLQYFHVFIQLIFLIF